MVERTVTPRWITIAIVAATTSCLATVIAHAVTVHAIRELGLPEAGQVFTPISGMTSAGRWLSLKNDRRCHLVRFASEECHFSKADDPGFRALEASLVRDGCDVTLLAPQSSLFPRGYAETDSRHLLYEVDLTFLDHAHLTRTPTTMLFDEQWRLVWRREGVLEPRDATVRVGR